MDGNAELIRLTELLRVGARTVREIAKHRPLDGDRLVEIALRSELMADELDAITRNHRPPELQ